MVQANNSQATADRVAIGRKLEKGGWGIALIWIGVAVMYDFGWENALFGLGAISLGGQLLRRVAGLPADWFATALGTCMLLIGLKSALGIDLGGVDLLPILSIALGSALVISALRRPRSA